MTPPLAAQVQQLEAENARLRADVLRLVEREKGRKETECTK